MSGEKDNSSEIKDGVEVVAKKLEKQGNDFVLFGASPEFLEQLRENGHDPSNPVVSGKILGRAIKEE